MSCHVMNSANRSPLGLDVSYHTTAPIDGDSNTKDSIFPSATARKFRIQTSIVAV